MRSILNTKEYDWLRNLSFAIGCTKCGAYRGQESEECKLGKCEIGRSPELYVMRKIESSRAYRVKRWLEQYSAGPVCP